MSSVSTSARPQPFLFDRSFDDPRKVYLPGEKYGPKIKVDLPKPENDAPADSAEDSAEATPPPPEKKYTEEDLEAAREEGQIAGHTTALEDAETAREHYMADALNMIAKGLDGLEVQQAEANKETGEIAMRMVYAVVEKVLPGHARQYAMDSMEALVREVLPLVYDEPTLVVRVHNMIADDVQIKLNEICERSNFNGSARVVPDYELQPGDCRVEWEGGGADRNEGRLWHEIRGIISDNVGPVDVDALDAAADSTVDMERAPENSEESVTEPEQPADDREPAQEEGENPSEP